MYIAKVIIILDPRLADTDATRRLLQIRLQELARILKPLGFAVTASDVYQYYENEEAEVRDIPSIALSCHLQATCRKFRSVPLLCLIAQSVAALFDGTGGVSYRCTVLDPEIVSHDDIYDVSS